MDTQPISNCCPKCQSPLPPDAPQGLCPKCLFAAVATPTEAGQPAGHRAPPPPLEEIAAAFPQLEILEFVGQGGMGFVFKARQPKLDRLVALKILPQSLAADPTFAERFNREARLLARLNHPGIVTVHDFGCVGMDPAPSALDSEKENGRKGEEGNKSSVTGVSSAPSPLFPPAAQPLYYLLMEFVDGVNLRQAMQAGRFTPEQALAIVPKICEALQFAHNEGILHRDIKPENILLDAKGRVKLADFGIAKLMGDVGQAYQPAGAGGLPAASSDAGNTGLVSPVNRQAGKPALRPDALTETGKALGTPNYMAPEQLANAGEVDHRADIYSLGVVFYEMLTGELPLGRFAPPSQKSAADPRVDKVVLRALEKEKAKRYASADEVKTQVETISSGSSRREEAQTESGSRKAESGKQTNPHFWSRTRVGIAGLAAFLVWLLVVIAATIVTFTLPNAYLGTASLKVDRSLKPFGDNLTAAYDPYFLQTEFEVIKTDAVLTNAATALSLNEKWGRKFNNGVPLKTSQTTELLRQRLNLQPIRNTTFIQLGVYSDSSKEAAELANAVADSYKTNRIQMRAAHFQNGLAQLEMQVAGEDAKLATARTQLANLQSELKISNDVARQSDEPASANAKEAPFWKKKREVENLILFRDALAKKIITETAQNAALTQTSPVTIMNRAFPPARPASPNVSLNIMLGVLGGVVVGLFGGVLTLLISYLRHAAKMSGTSSPLSSNRRESAQTELKQSERRLTSAAVVEITRPRALVVAAGLFIFTGLLSVAAMLFRSDASNLSFFPSAFALPIGIGLLRRREWCRRLATWGLALSFIFTMCMCGWVVGKAFGLYPHLNLVAMFLGQPVDGGSGAILLFLLLLAQLIAYPWLYLTLVRHEVRALFASTRRRSPEAEWGLTLIILLLMLTRVHVPVKHNWQTGIIFANPAGLATQTFWTDHLRLNQVVGSGGSRGVSRYGDDDFSYETLFDDKSCAITIRHRQEREANYRVQIEEKGNRRRAFDERMVEKTIRTQGRYQVVEQKKLIPRAEFDQIAAFVLQKQTANQPVGQLGFTPVLERPVELSMGSEFFWFDLEIGQSVPSSKSDEDTEPAAFAEWLNRSGVDFRVVEEGGGRAEIRRGLDAGTTGCLLVPANQSHWDSLPADRLPSLTASFTNRVTKPWLVSKRELPATLYFKTRAGTEGLLQITSFMESPMGVKIRYKLVQSRATDVTPVEDDVARLKREIEMNELAIAKKKFKAEVLSQGGKELSASNIVALVKHAYATIYSYRDSGWTMREGGFTSTNQFTQLLDRRKLYRIRVVTGANPFSHTNRWWSDGTTEFWQQDVSGIAKNSNPGTENCNVSLVSQDSFVPALFYNLGWGNILNNMAYAPPTELVRRNDEAVSGFDCYVLEQANHGWTLWVGKQDFLIRRYRNFISKASAAEARKHSPSPTKVPLPTYDITTIQTFENIIVNEDLKREVFIPNNNGAD